MKVFMDTDYEMLGYTIEELDLASSYTRRYGKVFDVPKKLVRRHQRLTRALDRLHGELEEIYDAGGEESPFAEQAKKAAQPKPRLSIYQLRHVKSGFTLIELTTPEGADWAWEPEPGREPDGVLQWWAQHWHDDRFNKLGEEFSYAKAEAGHLCRHRTDGMSCRRADGHRGEHIAWSDASKSSGSVISWSQD